MKALVNNFRKPNSYLSGSQPCRALWREQTCRLTRSGSRNRRRVGVRPGRK